MDGMRQTGGLDIERWYLFFQDIRVNIQLSQREKPTDQGKEILLSYKRNFVDLAIGRSLHGTIAHIKKLICIYTMSITQI